ncbi:c-type cytochrome [Aureimonas sp. AU40]|uniref:c-type cytochrome n=1 Tax=Aureimonas sp. AU40 TaxID=1637747 RepID=UPI000B15E9CB|nr:c-type cytochrome [Aureimonas sp. AU40]
MIRVLLLLLGLPVVAGLAFLAYALSPKAMEPVPRQSRAVFSELAIERGQRVARIGNCQVCHTAKGGPSYAGGYGVETPFGTIYGTNITPDEETGIGSWSLEAFSRALRQGIGQRGEHLYPAFPYDHFTKLSDGDVSALYAFLMTREPVRRAAPENDLPALLRFRPLLAGWKLLGFSEGRFEPDPATDERVDYGRYLVEGPGHCGACHTPRNLIQAEKSSQALEGGLSAGWSAPAIAGRIEVAVPWTQGTLETYLRDGYSVDHGAAAGPMQPVGVNLARTPAEDAGAIAAYLLSVMAQDVRRPVEPSQAEAAERLPGAALFASACAQCHGGGASASAQGLPLEKSGATHAETPRNLVNFILHGRQPSAGMIGPAMPGFAAILTPAQVAEIAAYVRARYSSEPPFAKLGETVDELVAKAAQP